MSVETSTEYVIAKQFTEETYSPYALAKVINKILSDLDTGKQIKTQMMYNYTAKGYIKAQGEGKGRTVTKKVAVEWAEKYVVRFLDTDEETTESE
jgi:hypothetical protein